MPPSAAAVDGAAPSSRMWALAANVVTKTEKHPFLEAMNDGSLPMDNFKYYVVQDALYLHDFAAALAILANNKGVSAADSEILAALAAEVETVELALHGSYFTGWGIDASSARPSPNTLLYTSYMLKVVSTESHAMGLAVLLPCFWVYMHVGQIMLKARQASREAGVSIPQQFDTWIDTYGGEEFETSVLKYRGLVDDAAAKENEAGVGRMERHFVKSCELEHMFWDAAFTKQEWPFPQT